MMAPSSSSPSSSSKFKLDRDYDYARKKRKKTKKKTRKDQDSSSSDFKGGDDVEDPERRRLLDAMNGASTDRSEFLPQSSSIGVGKFSLYVPTKDKRYLCHATRNYNDAEIQKDVATYRAMKSLFYMIVSKTQGHAMTWGDDDDNNNNNNNNNNEKEEDGEDSGGRLDPRQRMYGFLKRNKLLKEGIVIQKYGTNDINEHRKAVRGASVDLIFVNHNNDNNNNRKDDNNDNDDDSNIKDHHHPTISLDGCIFRALERVTQRVHSLVPTKYKKYATMDQLIAVQPNLHNGASYLPAHLDFPRNDGFGVIIVTIAISGYGVVILLDEGDPDAKTNNNDDNNKTKSFKLPLEEGEAYILCGDARNKYLHGVICERNSDRETMNLRYGLHSENLAEEEIDRHWQE